MSLKAAHSLSKGFENTLESHLHGVDGFFREHTTLPTPEVNAFRAASGGCRAKAGRIGWRYK